MHNVSFGAVIDKRSAYYLFFMRVTETNSINYKIKNLSAYKQKAVSTVLG